MESIGKFEFNRKDLIGHGAFAVVFKGKHKENPDWEVAVKCINKKNLSKSQSLLGKEIKILKELKHDNIVGLLDFQEMGGCVYLVMEYCNGGDLADYLHSKGTLSEDTIRGFLQQIAGAMRILKNKGILHRDLKPQNILLCHPEGRRSSPNNTCIKIADFGFARHLQINTMAATLCGSPMYMAPEVIMSQNYDAKADLWSIGTIVYQCLTGKAPFQASTPQELRLFYERNRSLLPSIPRETSSHLRHLLLGLLQKNHKERMDFDTFFHHPFLESTSTTKKSLPAVPVPVPSSPITGSDCSSSSSSTSHPASPQHSNAEMQRLLAKSPPSPTQDSPGLLLKAPANQNSRITTSDIEDFVMVPAQFPGEPTCEMGDGSPVQGSMTCSTPVEFGGSNYGQSVAIPVPTQLHNYQRMEQNLQPAGLRGSTRAPLCRVGSRGGSPPGCERPSSPAPELISRRLSAGGARPPQPSPLAGTVPESPEQTCPLSTRTEQLAGSPDSERPPISGRNIQRRDSTAVPPFEFSLPPSPPNLPSGPGASPLAATLRPACRVRTAPDLKSLGLSPATPPLSLISRNTAKRKGSFRRSLSTARLSDMLLKTAFGPQLLEGGTDDSLDAERPMDITAPPSGPDGVVFTVGCPSRRNTLPNIAPTRTHSGLDHPDHVSSFSSRLQQRGARRDSETSLRQRHSDPRADRCVTFEPPELPEETLMGQDHTDGLSHLRFTLAFVHCVMEIACSKDSGLEASDSPDVSLLQQSLVADQISLLSREWSYAEQLVLYMKAAECLSSALRAAMEDIRQGRLLPSSTVKQAVRKLNDLYKSSVASCRSLSARLRGFLFSKQRLMEHMSDVTAEKLIYSHTVHMVQSAALDEMFHRGQASMQRYHKALLLMEGLSMVITEQADIDNISKCKQCIERRLSALQTAQCV